MMYQSPPDSEFYESIQKYNKDKTHDLVMMYAFSMPPNFVIEKNPGCPRWVVHGYLCKKCGYGFSSEEPFYRYHCPKCKQKANEHDKIPG